MKSETLIEMLRHLNGLSLKDAASIPHPVDLAVMSREGLYKIDADRCVFRLTDKGHALAMRGVAS